MDQKTAAMIIVRFLKNAVALNNVDLGDECESCGREAMRGSDYCYACQGTCGVCGKDIAGSDWAWTGHCSRYCAVTVRNRMNKR